MIKWLVHSHPLFLTTSSMKNTVFLFTLLFGLAACASAVSSPTNAAVPATETPVPTRTATPTPTDTQTPTETPSPLETPTPAENPGIKPFFTEPPTLKDFPQGQKIYIPDVVTQILRNNHLTPGSKAPNISPKASAGGGEEHFIIECNDDKDINCFPEAFMQIQMQGIDVHLVFHSIRNKDGTVGIIIEYIFDSTQLNGPFGYPRLIANQNKPHEIFLQTGISTQWQKDVPFEVSLLTPEFLNAINELIATGNIPKALYQGENNSYMIAPGG
jgi:hypothetical protein